VVHPCVNHRAVNLVLTQKDATMRKYRAIGILTVLMLIGVLVSGCGGSSGTSGTQSGISPAEAGKATKLVFIVQPGGAVAGQVFATQPQIAIEDDNGNIVTTATGVVTLSIIGPVISGKINIPAVNGLAKFTGLSLDMAGNGFSFTATSYGLGGATSEPFNVAPEGGSTTSSTISSSTSATTSASIPPSSTSVPAVVPSKFVFSTQPGGAKAGQLFTTQPVVTIVDENGKVLTNALARVTLLLNATNNASISGTTAVVAVNGVAAFTDLSIDTAGTGYTLKAIAVQITSALSNPFDVSP
jgi:hypothetical protein